MSKERELLERVLTSELWSVQEELQAEIKKLLAQPESLTPRHALDSYWNQEAYKRGYARAELDLKREPLSKQAIWQIPNNYLKRVSDGQSNNTE